MSKHKPCSEYWWKKSGYYVANKGISRGIAQNSKIREEMLVLVVTDTFLVKKNYIQ